MRVLHETNGQVSVKRHGLYYTNIGHYEEKKNSWFVQPLLLSVWSHLSSLDASMVGIKW
jgi:hypothetical protein